MQLVNEFVVPRGVDETWAVLTDVERIAPAMPGAELTEITPDGQYHGTVKVKVGPVTAKYAGVASFKELDKANHHMVLDATGKESSGRGRAAALVSADLLPEGTDTRVRVTTDLTISGPLAQFGRGAIAEVSTRLLNQFVANLKETVLADGKAADAAAAQDDGASGPPQGTASPNGAASPGSVGSTVPPADTAPANDASTGAAPARGATTSTAPTSAVPTNTVPTSTVPVTAPRSAPVAEVNLLRVAAWPILKRLIPVIIVVAVVVVLLVWLL